MYRYHFAGSMSCNVPLLFCFPDALNLLCQIEHPPPQELKNLLLGITIGELAASAEEAKSVKDWNLIRFMMAPYQSE